MNDHLFYSVFYCHELEEVLICFFVAGLADKNRESVSAGILLFARALQEDMERIFSGVYQSWDHEAYHRYLKKFRIPEEKPIGSAAVSIAGDERRK